MDEMISLQHEGVCSVCKKKKIVVSIGNPNTKIVMFVCKSCSIKLGKEREEIDYFINKYGIVDEEPFKGSSIRIYSGKKEVS